MDATEANSLPLLLLLLLTTRQQTDAAAGRLCWKADTHAVRDDEGATCRLLMIAQMWRGFLVQIDLSFFVCIYWCLVWRFGVIWGWEC